MARAAIDKGRVVSQPESVMISEESMQSSMRPTNRRCGAIAIAGSLRRLALVAGLTLGFAGAAFAGATTAPLPPPDPTAANLTPAQIQERALQGCLATQSRLQGLTPEEVRQPCQCYARGTIRTMNKDDLAFFRATGYFSDATRARALEQIDRCKLQRPSL
jgi:hypothetical protein